MVTLTYPLGSNKQLQCKSHLREFSRRILRDMREVWFRRSEVTRVQHADEEPSIFWFMEFQKNGMAHFHLLINQFIHYNTIANYWYDIVGTGNIDHLQAGTRIEKLRLGRKGIASYAKKYANKTDQKLLPPMFKNSGGIGRFWGIVGFRGFVEAATTFETNRAGGFEHLKEVNRIDRLLESLVKQGKLRKMDYKLCDCWVTDLDDVKKVITEILNDTKETKIHVNQMLQQAKQIKKTDIQRERRRTDYLRGSRGWGNPNGT